MYYTLSVLSGCLVAVMIAINGGLTSYYGVFTAAVIIHFVGTVFSFAIVRLRKLRLGITRDIPLWLFMGGVIGVGTIFCNNLAFGKISITALVALGLLGQTLTSLVVDSLGLLGMQQQRQKPSRLLGLALAGLGIWVMLGDLGAAALSAVLLSICAGVSIVLSRTVNAGLAGRIGSLQGSFVNHAVGLPVTVVLLFLLGMSEPSFSGIAPLGNPFLYLGGTLGVTVVLLFNIIVPRLPSLHLTLLIFVGQVFTGVALDAILQQAYDAKTFRGGLLVAAGVLLNVALDCIQAHPQKKR